MKSSITMWQPNTAYSFSLVLSLFVFYTNIWLFSHPCFQLTMFGLSTFGRWRISDLMIQMSSVRLCKIASSVNLILNQNDEEWQKWTEFLSNMFYLNSMNCWKLIILFINCSFLISDITRKLAITPSSRSKELDEVF